MKAAEQRDMSRTLAAMECGVISCSDAARALAAIHRAGSKKTQAEVEQAARMARIASFFTVQEHGISIAI